MAWSEDEMRRAKIIYGPSEGLSDTYRLHLESGIEGVPGKMLDVPGYMVGNRKLAEEMMRAARIVEQRIVTGKPNA